MQQIQWGNCEMFSLGRKHSLQVMHLVQKGDNFLAKYLFLISPTNLLVKYLFLIWSKCFLPAGPEEAPHHLPFYVNVISRNLPRSHKSSSHFLPKFIHSHTKLVVLIFENDFKVDFMNKAALLGIHSLFHKSDFIFMHFIVAILELVIFMRSLISQGFINPLNGIFPLNFESSQNHFILGRFDLWLYCPSGGAAIFLLSIFSILFLAIFLATKTNQNQPKPTNTNQNQPTPTKFNQNQPSHQCILSIRAFLCPVRAVSQSLWCFLLLDPGRPLAGWA